MKKLARSLAAKAKKIKIIAMDVDGVLTGGEIIVLNSGEEVKIWNVKDRIAFHLVQRSGCGIKFAWITGRTSRQVAMRSKEIGIHALYQGLNNKIIAIEGIKKRFKVTAENIAYIGDDLVDAHALRAVGFSVCPKDSSEEIKKIVDYISPYNGGQGVLREIVEIILKTQGLWQQATHGYL